MKPDGWPDLPCERPRVSVRSVLIAVAIEAFALALMAGGLWLYLAL